MSPRAFLAPRSPAAAPTGATTGSRAAAGSVDGVTSVAGVAQVAGGAGVELSGVSRAFGPVRAVDRVDLTVPAGTIVALLGPSGCGKTTTLRLIAGFEAPDGGEVRIGGRLAAGPATFAPPERRRVGMVFQQLALFPHLDVAGNVGYGLRGDDRDRRRRAERVAAMLRLVGLAGY